jgi:phosphoenolpyruvate carboxylase
MERYYEAKSAKAEAKSAEAKKEEELPEIEPIEELPEIEPIEELTPDELSQAELDQYNLFIDQYKKIQNNKLLIERFENRIK